MFKNVPLLTRHEISYLCQANSEHFSYNATALLAFGWNWWSGCCPKLTVTSFSLSYEHFLHTKQPPAYAGK